MIAADIILSRDTIKRYLITLLENNDADQPMHLHSLTNAFVLAVSCNNSSYVKNLRDVSRVVSRCSSQYHICIVKPQLFGYKNNWIRGTKLLEENRYSLPLDFFFPVLPVLATFWNVKISIFFHFLSPSFCRTVLSNLYSPMSGLDNSAKTRYQPIFWHCLGAVLQYQTIFYENQH